MSKLLHRYRNGNYEIFLYEDGTKVRTGAQPPLPESPESIDIKLTDQCDFGCPFCSEGCTPSGKHADPADLLSRTKDLPAGVELAIGGGDPLGHPHLTALLTSWKMSGLVSNLTVNEGCFHNFHDDCTLQHLRSLQENGSIHGVGVSLHPWKENLNDYWHYKLKNVVGHVILGIHNVQNILTIQRQGLPILILGYKQQGRAQKLDLTDSVSAWKRLWPAFMKQAAAGTPIALDTLASQQLGFIKDSMPKELWSERWMGEDGQFTMFYDAVEQKYAPSSRHERVPAPAGLSLCDLFRLIREER